MEHRAGYYEQAGVVRDMFQNHLLQLLCLTAMEPPVAFEADAVRAEKVKVLQSIRPFREEDIDDWAVRGQYGPGVVEGKTVPGYRSEEKVDAGFRDRRRTRRSGSRSTTGDGRASRSTSGPASGWRSGSPRSRSSSRECRTLSFASAAGTLNPNVLRLRIQPDEGGVAEVRREDPRHAAAGPVGLHGLSLLEARRADPGRVRAAPRSTSRTATRRSSRAATRSSTPGAS